MRLWLLGNRTSKSEAHPSLPVQTLPMRDPCVLFLLLSRSFLSCHSWPLKMLQMSLLLWRPFRPRWYFCSLPYGQSCRMGRLRSNEQKTCSCLFQRNRCLSPYWTCYLRRTSYNKAVCQYEESQLGFSRALMEVWTFLSWRAEWGPHEMERCRPGRFGSPM